MQAWGFLHRAVVAHWRQGAAARWLVAIVVARVQSGCGAAAVGGVADKAKGKSTAGALTALTASPGAAFQAPTTLAKNLEEERRSPVVFKVDGEGSLRAADAGDLAPSLSHEDVARADDLDLRLRILTAAPGVLKP